MRTLPLVAALAATLLIPTTPALAGQSTERTWYVGPGGPVTAGPIVSSCDTPDFGLIQDGIDAAGFGDTVIVCDGVYAQGPLSIEGLDDAGLTLRGETPWGATIIAPDLANSFLDIIATSNVTVTHLRFRARAACTESMGRGILIQSSLNVDVRANRIINPPDSLVTGCGFGTGIEVYNSTGRARYNLLRDWRDQGIFIVSPAPEGGRFLVTENSLRFAPIGPLGAGTGYRAGILVYAEGTGFRTIINRNVVTVAKTGGLGAEDTPTLRTGIAWEANRVTVRDNRVKNADLAIAGFGGDPVLVTGNRARGITYDCYAQRPTGLWGNNDGRGWKSEPEGLCTVPR